MKLSSGFAAAAVGVAALAAALRPHAPPAAEAPQLALATPQIRSARTLRRASPAAALVVYVAGEVVRPGLYRLADGTRIDDAIRAAGGLTERGDRLSTDLAEPLRDGEEVLVAPAGSVDPYAVAQRSGASPARTRLPRARSRGVRGSRGSRPRRTSRKPLPAAPVDLNSADATELETLPGIGPGLAARIVAFREANGPFGTLDDLLDVAGMTDRKLDGIDPYARLGPRR